LDIKPIQYVQFCLRLQKIKNNNFLPLWDAAASLRFICRLSCRWSGLMEKRGVWKGFDRANCVKVVGYIFTRALLAKS